MKFAFFSKFYMGNFGESNKSCYLCTHLQSIYGLLGFHGFTFAAPGMWSHIHFLRRQKWLSVGQSVRTSLLFLCLFLFDYLLKWSVSEARTVPLVTRM